MSTNTYGIAPKKDSVFVSFRKLCEWSDWELNGSFPLSYKIERLLGIITASGRKIGFVRYFLIDHFDDVETLGMN